MIFFEQENFKNNHSTFGNRSNTQCNEKGCLKEDLVKIYLKENNEILIYIGFLCNARLLKQK